MFDVFDNHKMIRYSNSISYMAVLRGRRSVVFATILLILSLGLLESQYSLHQGSHTQTKPSISRSASSPRESAGNSTLGFQKLLALSSRPSWRTRGLEAAAKLTGLQFTIPTQGQGSEELVKAFKSLGSDRGATVPGLGSAKAWLAHIDLLKFVIASDLETAFIVEDDVDWDVRIKTQMRLVSENIRAYTGVGENDTAPFGTRWDVLWLGHCGSFIGDHMTVPLVFADDSRCETDLYSGWSKGNLNEHLMDGYRQVQKSLQTVCTFGYGVTRHGAQKVVGLLSQGADEAFDIALSSYCKSQELDCLVVNPQLFNHYEPPSDTGYVSDVHVGDEQKNSTDDSNIESYKGTTGNIRRSARCEALFHDVCMRPPSEI
ncbi:glycosyltransferase family 25 protein [Hypoxylon sp. NC1633]|nr:glycosyltransferase family 25 protein [Hypoxylon sp. NC1633]